MNLTTHQCGANVHVTARANQGCRIAQGPIAIWLDAVERANLLAWLQCDANADLVYTTTRPA